MLIHAHSKPISWFPLITRINNTQYLWFHIIERHHVILWTMLLGIVSRSSIYKISQEKAGLHQYKGWPSSVTGVLGGGQWRHCLVMTVTLFLCLDVMALCDSNAIYQINTSRSGHYVRNFAEDISKLFFVNESIFKWNFIAICSQDYIQK